MWSVWIAFAYTLHAVHTSTGIKEGPSQAVLTFPLVLITLYFGSYLSQQHYRVAQVLPTGNAMAADAAKEADGFPVESFAGSYLQKALSKRVGHIHDSDLPPPSWERHGSNDMIPIFSRPPPSPELIKQDPLGGVVRGQPGSYPPPPADFAYRQGPPPRMGVSMLPANGNGTPPPPPYGQIYKENVPFRNSKDRILDICISFQKRAAICLCSRWILNLGSHVAQPR